MAEQVSSSQKLALTAFGQECATNWLSVTGKNNNNNPTKKLRKPTNQTEKKNKPEKKYLYLTTEMPLEEPNAETVTYGSGQNTFLLLCEFSWCDQSGQWLFTAPLPPWVARNPSMFFHWLHFQLHSSPCRCRKATCPDFRPRRLYCTAHACCLASPLWFVLLSSQI